MSKYRKELEKLTDERRYSFRGILTYTGYKDTGRYSYNHGTLYSPTFMLKNVEYWNKENNSWVFVADHLWMNYTKQFKYYFPLLKGDFIYFNGRITKYSYKDGINVRVSMPTKVKVEREGNLIEKTCTDVIEDWVLVNIIDKENREYYEARDKIDSLFRMKHYFFVVNNIGEVEVFLNIGGQWLSKRQYKNKYQNREDVIAIYKKNPKPKSKIIVYGQDQDNVFERTPNPDGSLEVSPSEIQKLYNKHKKSCWYDYNDYYYEDDEEYEDEYRDLYVEVEK